MNELIAPARVAELCSPQYSDGAVEHEVRAMARALMPCVCANCGQTVRWAGEDYCERCDKEWGNA